jgi:adenosylcobinamide amidohydrolase
VEEDERAAFRGVGHGVRTYVAMPAALRADVVDRDGWPALRWRPRAPVLAVASSVVGGGLGLRHWVVNATVPHDWHGEDEAGVVAAAAGDERPGCGLLTAADVRWATAGEADGCECLATVGLGRPVWAAAAPLDGSAGVPRRPGTVNLVAWVPVPLSPAALVNAACTATEAKVQALVELGIPGTGTPTDAVVVCCPPAAPDGAPPEAYGGPRSRWGARLARAVHVAVRDGAIADHDRATAAGHTRPWSPPGVPVRST